MTFRSRPAVIFFVLILMSFCSLIAYAEDNYFSEAGQMLGYLREQKPSEMSCFCSEELYSFFRENNFRELYRLLVKAGADHSAAGISYNDGSHYLSFSSLTYTGLPWAECGTEEDVDRALRQLVPFRSDFLLLCSDEVYSALIGDKRMSIHAARHGIDTYSYSFSSDTGIVKLTDQTFFDAPYVVVTEPYQFTLAIADFAAQNTNDFYIVFAPELFKRITENSVEMTMLKASSKLSSYEGSYDTVNCTFHYRNVTFTDMPREICRSFDDMVDAIRRMGISGISDFELIFPDQDVFEQICADDFALLFEAESRAGMADGNLAYDLSGGRLIFTDTEILASASVLDSLSAAVASAEEQSEAGSRDIRLFCTPELYLLLLRNASYGSLERIYDLISILGIGDYDITTSERTHTVSIHINSYLAGTAILRAVRRGDASGLSERELLTWQAASDAASAALDADPLRTAVNIHDWICSHVTYYIDELSDEDDSAIGAILNGRANCDGYADAFFLIGSLAGLNVRYQHGDSLDKSSVNFDESVSHLWNLLETGGVWHMVDVTWDDEEYGWTHAWFNVGRDKAEMMHYWNEDMTVPIAETTERMDIRGYDFVVRSPRDLQDAVDSAALQRLPFFYILFDDPSLACLYEEAKDAVGKRIMNSTLTYSLNEKMFLMGFYDLQWR